MAKTTYEQSEGYQDIIGGGKSMSDKLLLKDIAKTLAKHGVYDVEDEILAKVKQRKADSFRKALEQSRRGEPLDLSEEELELFSAIQNDGIAKAYQKRLDRPDMVCPDCHWSIAFERRIPIDCPKCKGAGTIPIDTPFSDSLQSTDCPTCKGTGKVKGLDRPDREKISRLELYFTSGNYDICEFKEGHTHLLPTGIDKILALIPDIEELERGIKKQAMDTIKGIEEMYEGDEANIIEEAKKQERERIIRHLKSSNPFVGYVDAFENIRMAKEQGWDRAWQALKEEKC